MSRNEKWLLCSIYEYASFVEFESCEIETENARLRHEHSSKKIKFSRAAVFYDDASDRQGASALCARD